MPRRACLFTIGYEGKSVEVYLQQLVARGVTLLCDVRKNPVSRKYGFSKRRLQELARGEGISYVHIPGLGIDSRLRKNVRTVRDVQKLFSHYDTKILPKRSKELALLQNFFRTHTKVAITCFDGSARAVPPKSCGPCAYAAAWLEDSDPTFMRYPTARFRFSDRHRFVVLGVPAPCWIADGSFRSRDSFVGYFLG